MTWFRGENGYTTFPQKGVRQPPLTAMARTAGCAPWLLQVTAQREMEVALGKRISVPTFGFLASRFARTRDPRMLAFLDEAYAVMSNPRSERASQLGYQHTLVLSLSPIQSLCQ